MNTYRIVAVLIISFMIVTTNGFGEEEKKHRPNAAERAIGFIDPSNRWDRLKSWIKVGLVNYAPSSKRTEEPHSDADGVLKEAVTKSFEASKETAEHAAKGAGQAMHNTAEKVKRTVSGSGGKDEENEL